MTFTGWPHGWDDHLGIGVDVTYGDGKPAAGARPVPKAKRAQRPTATKTQRKGVRNVSLCRVSQKHEPMLERGDHMRFRTWLAVVALVSFSSTVGFAQPLPKARVADLIKKVEDGVDAFRDYLEKREDNAREKAPAAQGARSRRGGATATEARKDQAAKTKDELDDALGDLNRSTNRLRRQFDATDKWMETKGDVERVVDDGRKINQYVAKGSYGSEVARLWATLRTGINDLARAYGVTPLGI